MLIVFFSIAGVPPFTGFFAKIVILLELTAEQNFFLAGCYLLISSISVFYYIKIIKMLFFEPSKSVDYREEAFQIIFYNKELRKVYFVLSLLIFLLITILLFPTNLYLFCEYIVLTTTF